MPEPAHQYVILHHVLAEDQHWDLMLEDGETLATWQLTRDPAALVPSDARGVIPAKRIGDHRRAYLEYEGEVSGRRGRVNRVDKGSYELIEQAPAAISFRLDGALLVGVFRIVADSPGGEGLFQRGIG